MANFAKLGLDNVVLEIVVLDNIDTMTPQGIEDEEIGIKRLIELTGHLTWKQCSFNTHRGQHRLGGIPFRKNYPIIGHTYDSERDAFIPPKPADYFVFNEETCNWDFPTPMPLNPPEGQMYFFNIETLEWELRSADYTDV
jgi:hypothetical protein